MYLTLQFIGKVNKRLTLSYSAIKIPEFPDFSLFHSFKKLLIPPPLPTITVSSKDSLHSLTTVTLDIPDVIPPSDILFIPAATLKNEMLQKKRILSQESEVFTHICT